MQKQAGELGILGFLSFPSLFHYRFAFSSPFWSDPPHSALPLFFVLPVTVYFENVRRIFSRHLLSRTTCRLVRGCLSLERFAICYYKEVILQPLCFTASFSVLQMYRLFHVSTTLTNGFNNKRSTNSDYYFWEKPVSKHCSSLNCNVSSNFSC